MGVIFRIAAYITCPQRERVQCSLVHPCIYSLFTPPSFLTPAVDVASFTALVASRCVMVHIVLRFSETWLREGVRTDIIDEWVRQASILDLQDIVTHNDHDNICKLERERGRKQIVR
ncbi:hypothetical protein M406DRAFT_101695 [Cryphonectria parasitica EP155]|uniref:Uncharacterized protein n=1 Tax=Cryphonectria parasitica (strain ATCC 38755 / EP155) TaxID=660469 RepID=A0A9P4Y4X3_CRYP1|nr:uncharacterized protein M406DRAFT_101695 [Cryphonectria parasitica EP155]KAF3766407.1 hypothetical protein M406DRAFT_101695 [Cryphonectria parasitica EP155]